MSVFREMTQEEFEDLIRERLMDAIEKSPAEDTEILAFSFKSALTRFANNGIHQNHHEENAEVTVRCAVGQRWGAVVVNNFEPDVLRQAVENATDIARLLPDDPEFVPSAEGPYHYMFEPEFGDGTAACSPSRRALVIKQGLEEVPDGYEAAGTLSTGSVTLAVFTSRGVDALTSTSNAKYTVLMTGPTSSGYAEGAAKRLRELDVPELARQAAEKGKMSENPRDDLPTGRYTVILEESALSDWLMFFAWTGFGGKEYSEGESFLAGRMNERVTGESITIIDDASDPRTFGLPFDFEGIPKQKIVLINGGVASAIAHSRATAKKTGMATTGHSLGSAGAYPLNMIMQPGDHSKKEMIKATDRGVLVSRFHYSNLVDQKKTVFTGLTRDGTFLIENGEIVTGLTNFRWTVNALESLAKADMISSETKFSSAFFGGGSVVPAIRTHDFHFSGKSEH